MISVIGNFLAAFAGFLQPLMNLSSAVYDLAAYVQRWLPGVMALWAAITKLLGIFGL